MSAATSTSSLEIGSAFAGYRIDGLLDRQQGGGIVYVATHLESERLIEFPPWPIALKVFRTEEDPSFLRRFAEVAKRQSRLRHPNTVSIYEVGTSPAPFLSMTLFWGPNLHDLLGDDQQETPQTACPTCRSTIQ